MAGDFLLALVVICWVLWTHSRIRPALFERLDDFSSVVSKINLHVKIKHGPLLLERLVLRIASCRIHGNFCGCHIPVGPFSLSYREFLLQYTLLILKVVQNILISLFFDFLGVQVRVCIAGGSKSTILVIILVY